MERILSALLTVLLLSTGAMAQSTQPAAASDSLYKELHRPQIHFSPREKWTNDPNGLVYYAGTYHLFFQYYPDSTIWGPMHWGHATSTNMIQWQQQPIALYPDSLGYIFSGSAVVDANNSSGLGKKGIVPLVAIFTHHNAKEERAGSHTYQQQSLAYSLDSGKTWQKYKGNPVLKNPGITDFRDPKVSWHAASKKWIMTLATKDCISFFSSPDLKHWQKESEFGKTVGAHGGVWECPDLFPLICQGKTIWVLLVSINPGGPNGGSATQYFTGDFDGSTFHPFETDTRWVDYGADDYAGVTWSNTGSRRIFIGWMSNWQYAGVVPTQRWRNAMTLPRELTIIKNGDKYLLASNPVHELTALREKQVSVPAVNEKSFTVPAAPFELRLSAKEISNFSISFSNELGQELTVGFDKTTNNYFVDRTRAGAATFYPAFAARHTGPRLTQNEQLDLTIIIDNASVELFADKGLTTMTDIFFPDKPLSTVKIQSPTNFIHTLSYDQLKSIWPQ